MRKNAHVIVLNGRHYDAHTGEDLAQPGTFAAGRKPAGRVHRAHTAAPHATRSHHAPHSPRQPGRHVAAHAPRKAQTLMRQAVKKPPLSAKRRIRVQSRVDVHTQPVIILHRRPSMHRGAKVSSSRLINHFSPKLFIITESALSQAAKRPVRQATVPVDVRPAPRPRSTAELLEYAVQYADVPKAMDWPVSRKRQHRTFRRRHSHAIGASA